MDFEESNEERSREGKRPRVPTLCKHREGWATRELVAALVAHLPEQARQHRISNPPQEKINQRVYSRCDPQTPCMRVPAESLRADHSGQQKPEQDTLDGSRDRIIRDRGQF